MVRAYLLYSEHRGSMLADSITYRALFSVFAGVLLGFSIAALWLGGNPDAMRALAESLDTVLPGLSDIVDVSAIDGLSAGFTVAGIASIAGLVGAAIGAIGSLRAALLTLDDRAVDQTSGILVVLRKLFVAICFGGLLVLAAAASFLGSLGLGFVADVLGFSEESTLGQTLARIVGIVIVFGIDTVAVALVFRLLSDVRAPRRDFWAGAMLGGAGLVVLQELSGLFVRGAGSNPLLGAFAALIALLLWFNLSAQVLLIASSYIICAAHEAHDRVRVQHGASTLVQLNRQRAEDRLRAATEELRVAQEAERTEHEKLAEADSGATA